MGISNLPRPIDRSKSKPAVNDGSKQGTASAQTNKEKPEAAQKDVIAAVKKEEDKKEDAKVTDGEAPKEGTEEPV